MAKSSGKTDQSVYAAGQAREFLRNALEGKENSWINEFAGYIDDPDVLDWLNYRCSIYAEQGENFLDTRLAEIVIRSAATRTADRALKEGNASQLQGFVGLQKHTNDATDAMREIVDRLADEGCVALVVGPPGAGKTATTLDAARGWGVQTGGQIYGNTSWDGFDDVVHTDVELLEAMASTKRQTLGVIDESNQNLSGEGADAKKAQAFVDRMTFIRKKEGQHGPHAKRGSALIVGHTLMKTAADIRRLATLVIQKPSRADPGKVVLYESPGGADEREQIGEYKGLTDTRENYREHEASHFDVELDDDTDDDGVTIDHERREAIKTVIRLLDVPEGDRPSYREVARAVPYGKDWVGSRWRDYQEDAYTWLNEGDVDGT